MGYLAGIDLGTSSVKTLIMTPEGKTLAVSHADYEVMTPKMGYAEQDPQIWWERTVKTVREALAVSQIRPEELVGIGFSGQMHGLVALDKEKKPVMPAIIWMDQRSAVEMGEIKELAAEFLDAELLNQPGAGMMICSLLWLKKNAGETYEKIRYVYFPCFFFFVRTQI